MKFSNGGAYLEFKFVTSIKIFYVHIIGMKIRAYFYVMEAKNGHFAVFSSSRQN